MRSAKIVTLPRTATLEEISNVISRDGGVIIENFVGTELVDRMNAKLQPYIDREDITAGLDLDMVEIQNRDEDLMPDRTYRIWGLLGKMPEEISEIVQHPIWSGVMDDVLSLDTEDYYGTQLASSRSSYTLNITNSFTILPGAKRQSLHRDHRAQMIEPDGTGYTSMVTCLIAGTKVTKRNGATMVIPGSHKWGKGKCGHPSEAVPAEMAKGSAFFFLGSVFHGAGANTSEEGSPDSVRQLFAVGACRDFYRPDENFLLSTPMKVIKSLPEAVLQHTGWRRNIAGAGFVEFQEPFDMIDKLPLLAHSCVKSS